MKDCRYTDYLPVTHCKCWYAMAQVADCEFYIPNITNELEDGYLVCRYGHSLSECSYDEYTMEGAE
jgi:hypothetical protein